MLEKLLTTKEAFEVMNEGLMIKSLNNVIFRIKNKKVWVKSLNATYTLSVEDFFKLYIDTKFIVLEDSEQLIDSKKDEEYYSFKHK